MSDAVSVNRRHLSLPWAAAATLLGGIVSGTGVYYTLKGDVQAARAAADAVHAQATSWEATGRERFGVVERRVERLEETSQRTLIVLERIDERTAEMKRRLDAQITPAR